MLLLISSVGRTVLHNAEGVPSHVRDAQDRLVGLVLAVVDGSLVDSGFESFARLRHVVERFLEILVQAGSHGGAHRVAKAAELVYCDVLTWWRYPAVTSCKPSAAPTDGEPVWGMAQNLSSQ